MKRVSEITEPIIVYPTPEGLRLLESARVLVSFLPASAANV